MPPSTRGSSFILFTTVSTNSAALTPIARIFSASVVPNASFITEASLGIRPMMTFKSSFNSFPLPIICENWFVTSPKSSAEPPDMDTAFASSSTVIRAFSALMPTFCSRIEAFTACSKSSPGAIADFRRLSSSTRLSAMLRPAS